MLAGAMAALLMVSTAAAQIAAPEVGASKPEADLYHYRAIVMEVIDGDTVVVDLDLGFHTWIHGEHIRLFGINAPEHNQPGGAEATEFLRDRVEGVSVILQTIKGAKGVDRQEKYGRYLGILWLGDTNINEFMIQAGHAKPYGGKGPRP
jgi:micrococcal nuclease